MNLFNHLHRSEWTHAYLFLTLDYIFIIFGLHLIPFYFSFHHIFFVLMSVSLLVWLLCLSEIFVHFYLWRTLKSTLIRWYRGSLCFPIVYIMISLYSLLVFLYCMMSLKNQDLGTSGVFISNRISKKIICNAV